MAERGTGAKILKWGMIGGAIAGGAALIPLIPVIKKRAMRVTTILKKDHRIVGGLLMTLQITPRVNATIRKSLFEQIRNSLLIHAQAEEELLYPVMRNYMITGGESKVEESYREHQQIKDLLTDLSTIDPLTDAFDSKLSDLKDRINHHVEEEENEMF